MLAIIVLIAQIINLLIVIGGAVLIGNGLDNGSASLLVGTVKGAEIGLGVGAVFIGLMGLVVSGGVEMLIQIERHTRPAQAQGQPAKGMAA